jgi:hypothetical protein
MSGEKEKQISLLLLKEMTEEIKTNWGIGFFTANGKVWEVGWGL